MISLPYALAGLILVWALFIGYVLGHRATPDVEPATEPECDCPGPISTYLHVVDWDPLEVRSCVTVVPNLRSLVEQ